MNIQLLLSGAQSQGASSVTKQTLYSTLESSQGAFRQALSQAANAPSNASQTRQTSDPAAITAQPLQALGFEFSEQSLASLLSGESYAGEALTPLDEIAARMDLVALFADMPSAADAQLDAAPTLGMLPQQLNMSKDQVAKLLGSLDTRPQPGPTSVPAKSVPALLSTLTDEQVTKLLRSIDIHSHSDPTSVSAESEPASLSTLTDEQVTKLLRSIDIRSQPDQALIAESMPTSLSTLTNEQVAELLSSLDVRSQPDQALIAESMPTSLSTLTNEQVAELLSSLDVRSQPDQALVAESMPASLSTLTDEQVAKLLSSLEIHPQSDPIPVSAELGPASLSTLTNEQVAGLLSSLDIRPQSDPISASAESGPVSLSTLTAEQVAEFLSTLDLDHQPDQALVAASLTTLTEEQAGQLISALNILLAPPQNSGGALPLNKDVPRQASVLPVQLLNSQSTSSQGLPNPLHAPPPPTISQTPAAISSQEFLTQLGALAPVTQADSQAMLSVLEDRDPSLRASPIATALSGHTALGNTSSIAAPGVPTAQASIGTSVNSPAWPAQLGQQLVQFAQRGGEQQVKMQLHPAELGPLSITLKVSEQGTQAHFLASHMQVRQVIEQAIPQLREALAEQGISLGETSVGEQHSSNEQAFAQNGDSASSNGSGGVSEANSDSVTPAAENHSITLDGRVDLYA